MATAVTRMPRSSPSSASFESMGRARSSLKSLPPPHPRREGGTMRAETTESQLEEEMVMIEEDRTTATEEG